MSLNPTAALLCSYADGNHSLGEALSQLQEVFPDSNPLLADFVACGEELAARGFLHWL